MLIVHPNSTCDVCLEGYGRGAKAPHSITCGHVFCLSCLESITSGACPLCRERFHPMETRKLHVDTDSGATPIIGPPIDTTESSQEARRLQDSIARIVKDGSSESHLRQLIEDCSNFLRTQPRNMYEELRLSHRMISYLCDIKSKLKKQTEAYAKLVETLADLESQRDTLRSQLTAEQEAVDTSERRYRELLQTSRDEKETALAVERSLRSHYEDIAKRFGLLEEQYKSAEAECRKLNDEINYLRYRSSPRHNGRRIYSPDGHQLSREASNENISSSGYQVVKHEPIDEPMAVDKDEMILSPLPEDIRPLPSSLNSFCALPEVEFEDREKDIDMKSIRSLNTCVEEPLKRAPDTHLSPNSRPRGSEPIPINLSWSTGGPSRASPRLHDSWEGTRRTSSRASSRHASRSRSRPSSPSPLIQASTSLKQPGHDRYAIQESLTRDLGPSRERRLINEPEQLKSHLYEILGDPVSSSLPNMSHFPIANTAQSQDTRPPSRSASISSHRSAPQLPPPLPPQLTIPSNSSSASSLPHKPKDMTPGPRPVMSHASIAALALEKERQRNDKERAKAEKERQKEERDRQRDRERERKRQLSSGSTSGSTRGVHSATSASTTGSLRDTTNAYNPRNLSAGTGKPKGPTLASLYA